MDRDDKLTSLAEKPAPLPDNDEGMAARRPRRLGKRAVRRRWDRFDNDEVFCMLSVLAEQDRRHQFNRGIEPERSLLAELQRECRRRGIVADDDD